NGVSALHTELMKTTVFHNLHRLYPDRIVNETNSITPRRSRTQCHPDLTTLIRETVGDAFLDDVRHIADLNNHATDGGFQERFAAVKHGNKVRLARLILD